MSKMQDLYTGSAGQAAVMSEFLIRGYNVAVPEVDRGDDLFVVEDATGNYSRIQVKTATGSSLKKAGYKAQFNIPLVQLQTPQTPNLHYVLVVRHDDRWRDFVIIERNVLLTEHTVHGVGTLAGKKKQSVMLYLSFRHASLTCSKRSFQGFRNNFSRWPRIQH